MMQSHLCRHRVVKGPQRLLQTPLKLALAPLGCLHAAAEGGVHLCHLSSHLALLHLQGKLCLTR